MCLSTVEIINVISALQMLILKPFGFVIRKDKKFAPNISSFSSLQRGPCPPSDTVLSFGQFYCLLYRLLALNKSAGCSALSDSRNELAEAEVLDAFRYIHIAPSILRLCSETEGSGSEWVQNLVFK